VRPTCCSLTPAARNANGWDIAERCRETHPEMPVIYATGFSHMEPRPVPNSVWLQKPYKAERVAKVIRDLTRSS